MAEAQIAGASPVDPGAGGSTARDSLTYAVGGLAGKAAGVLLLPILARGLGPDDYGRFDLVSTIGSALTVVGLLGFDAALTRHYVDAAHAADRRPLVSTAFGLPLVAGIAIGLTLLVAAEPLAATLRAGPQAEPAIRWLALVVPAGILNYLVLAHLRVRGRATTYAAISAGVFFLNALLAGVAVGILRLGADAAVAAWGLSLALILVAGLATSVRTGELGLTVDGRRAGTLLAFGMPLVPAAGVIWGVEVANRSVLLSAAGPGAVGELSVALRVASLIGLVGTAFLLAWQPRAFAGGLAGPHLALVASQSGQFLVLASAAALLMTAGAPLVVSLLAGDGFAAAASLVGALCVAAVAGAAIQVVSVGSTLLHRSTDLSLALITGALVGAVLNAFAAARLGAPGTAISIVVGQVVGLVVMLALARRRVVIAYDWIRLGAIGLILVVAAWYLESGLAEAPVLRAAAALLGTAAIIAIGRPMLAAAPRPSG